MNAPTQRQLEFLRAVHARAKGFGRPPTYRELLEDLGATSLNTIECLVRPNLRAGLLEKEKGSARSLRVTSAGLRALGEACCRCRSCACSCHVLATIDRAVIRNVRAGPAEGESLAAFAVRLQQMLQTKALVQ